MTINIEEFKSAAEIARLVRGKSISPVEVTEATLSMIERRDPSLNAFVHLDLKGARNAARLLEARIMRGEDPGILAGVPTAMKDLFNMYPGWPSTFGGIPSMRHHIVEHAMSLYPRRMEAAGAIVLGNTNSPILGFRGTCDNPVFGPTKNPFDVTRNSGGSSGGSAAAVADGMLPIGGANDGGGSIRIPAAWCGVFGFQPSYGRVPHVGRPDAFDISPFVYEGSVTRTVEDNALALKALSHYDGRDPFSIVTQIDWPDALGRSIKGKKVALSLNLGGYPVEPQISEKVFEAMKAFEDLGAYVVPIDIKLPFSHEDITETWCRLVGTKVAGALGIFKAMGFDLRNEHHGDLPEALWTYVDRAQAMTFAELRQDQLVRTSIYDLLQGILTDADFLACPTVASLPVLNSTTFGETVGPASIAGQFVNPLIGWCLTYWTNLTGNPAASLPAGLVDGLPVGLQLIGRRNQDLDLLAACSAFEMASPWIGTYGICRDRLL